MATWHQVATVATKDLSWELARNVKEIDITSNHNYVTII